MAADKLLLLARSKQNRSQHYLSTSRHFNGSDDKKNRSQHSLSSSRYSDGSDDSACDSIACMASRRVRFNQHCESAQSAYLSKSPIDFPPHAGCSFFRAGHSSSCSTCAANCAAANSSFLLYCTRLVDRSERAVLSSIRTLTSSSTK